ncbi:type II toxin-antitoxin system VapC family toxin [Actinomycetospora termitidis]|uniref:Ribonuclease VapC n=1 Tax=Actinomycetospora termitidis TaxID=3053470 RepID=A0ABT7MEI2_9PSEU|nr:type II toxin-antitoxin system VapC family toxin [Actinomycetospora sp. Odt1-22]MDL5159069.1 type II toxin-antitoxin system VapC family toxin [Actinomycetospora sp. Odt1-22]
MTLVVDASVVVASLVDDGTVGRWARAEMVGEDLAAPHLMPFEAANVLRRSVLRGDISDDVGRLAHADLLDLPVTLVDFATVAPRVWELRGAVSSCDGAYVALAEVSSAPVLTLDLRLARSPGPRCSFRTPGDLRG